MFRLVNRFNYTIFKKINYRNASTISNPAVANIEGQWKSLSETDKSNLIKKLEELQKQDWNKLSIDDKRAAYYVSFGPHGPREPLYGQGHTSKVIIGISGIIAASLGFLFLTKKAVPEHPKTLTKEWQEATNEKMRRQKADPITGISSEGYKGKGYVE
ncbi:cytochrome c oxidase subunit IV [Gigaspora margarita]|uniref:Cytochrome c oxidase subunit IV n=1 Tax=Gigaspora margarita TaxID=4874 RepID=A0A8H4EQI5_GIGMA|nr:cytochrome c oxidase subunit IV [Gigaspora margarita]